MKPLSAFYPFVLPWVEGCPGPMADQAILSSAIEFATKSQVVQITYTDNVLVGVEDYDIEIPSQMVLTNVLRVYHKDTRLTPAALHSVSSGLALRGENIGTDTALTGDPKVYFTKDPMGAQVSLYPLPVTAVTDGLTVRAALAPARTATLVEDTLFDDFAEAIACGALARLYGIPGQSFTNEVLTRKHETKFSAAIKSATSTGRTGQVVASSRVAPVRFT